MRKRRFRLFPVAISSAYDNLSESNLSLLIYRSYFLFVFVEALLHFDKRDHERYLQVAWEKKAMLWFFLPSLIKPSVDAPAYCTFREMHISICHVVSMLDSCRLFSPSTHCAVGFAKLFSFGRQCLVTAFFFLSYLDTVILKCNYKIFCYHI